MITAKFGSKSFEVSPKKIYTPDGLSLSEELEMEETEVNGFKPKQKVKAMKLQQLSFDLKLDSRFVDVNSEIWDWKKILESKTSRNFSLGSNVIGIFFLIKYELKETRINRNGSYTGATLSLSFVEDGNFANWLKNPSGSDYNSKAADVKDSAETDTPKVRKGSTIKPKSGVRWYSTADGALKKSGTSGKAYNKNMKVTHTYSKDGKIVCVNPEGLGWLKVEDVTIVKY